MAESNVLGKPQTPKQRFWQKRNWLKFQLKGNSLPSMAVMHDAINHGALSRNELALLTEAHKNLKQVLATFDERGKSLAEVKFDDKPSPAARLQTLRGDRR